MRVSLAKTAPKGVKDGFDAGVSDSVEYRSSIAAMLQESFEFQAHEKLRSL